MFSKRTILELTYVIEELCDEHAKIDRLITVFNFDYFLPIEKATKAAKFNKILSSLLNGGVRTGPFSNDIYIDLLEFNIDLFFKRETRIAKGGSVYDGEGGTINFKNAFIRMNPALANNLKRDGYTVEEKTIKKLLPVEIEEAKTESELLKSLDKYDFITSKGHLDQAISNHSQGNWAGANSQFRTFVESALTDIAKILLPNNQISTAAKAIKLLSETVNPPFLSKELNEVPNTKENDSLIWGIWARLHPEGSHPGLSDEDDCTFRYHISIVLVNYLMRRLDNRKNIKA